MIAKPPPAGEDLGEVDVESKNASHWYISGPHSRDYYLLLDEQADHIFATRLAAHSREVHGSLREIWTDDIKKHVWYVFEA